MSKCKQCSVEFNCKADKSCWCTSYPPITWANPEHSCFCPDCLIMAMAQEINNSTTLPDATMKAEIAALGIPTTLTHMVDYTLNKEGLMILSRWFLLRRGHCCQNGCQYCPY